MKKWISFVLSFALLIGVLPFSVSADEEENIANQLVTDACIIFPEYASKISSKHNGINPASIPAESKTLLVQESRPLTNSTTIHYSEYSDGTIMLASDSVSYSTTVVDSVTGGVKTTYTININASLVGYSGCTCTLKNVKYMIDSSGYDKIISQGTSQKDTNCTSVIPYIVYNTETSSRNAMAYYDIYYRFGSGEGMLCWTQLTLEVGNNGRYITYENLEGW